MKVVTHPNNITYLDICWYWHGSGSPTEVSMPTQKELCDISGIIFTVTMNTFVK